MQMLAAGEKNTPISIRSRQEVQSSSGAVSYTWQTIADGDCWAKKFDRSGAGLFVADQELSKVSTRFQIDYREDVDHTMQVLCNTKEYNIVAVLDLTGNREFIELMCEIGVSNG